MIIIVPMCLEEVSKVTLPQHVCVTSTFPASAISPDSWNGGRGALGWLSGGCISGGADVDAHEGSEAGRCRERAGTEKPGNVLTTAQEGSHFPRGQGPVTSRPANLTKASCSSG